MVAKLSARPRALVAIIAMLAAVLAALTLAAPGPASAAPAAHAVAAQEITPGMWALTYAEDHYTGCWYYYGGEACSPGFDCSGLVQKSVWEADHIVLPRTTYGMLASWHLYRVRTPIRGDLAFYGSGHVEFATVWYHTTFGAHDWGSRVGYAMWGGWWQPTAFYRIR